MIETNGNGLYLRSRRNERVSIERGNRFISIENGCAVSQHYSRYFVAFRLNLVAGRRRRRMRLLQTGDETEVSIVSIPQC